MTPQELERVRLEDELRPIIRRYSNEYSPAMIIDLAKIVLHQSSNGFISKELRAYIET